MTYSHLTPFLLAVSLSPGPFPQPTRDGETWGLFVVQVFYPSGYLGAKEGPTDSNRRGEAGRRAKVSGVVSFSLS